ncbi:unnamed protein product [Nezara viridula]|uniref:Retinoblastoma-like protein 1 n=1 Tax=Nezara viridula TaxID=85310 RepID=A0A9P0HN52_NEZVI|nr:unnamed protein product [Nezara viridula]
MLPEDTVRRLYKQFHELCRALNLDKTSSAEAWRSFNEIYEPYMLAGEPQHWMGCALYVACKTATVATVSKSPVIIQGNLVNLKGLLKLIDLSIVDFFKYIRRWANFAKLSVEFLRSLDQFERDFTVSMVLFKKFQPIFKDIFSENNADNAKVNKNKKQKNNQIPLIRIFDFSWTLFICVKSNYPKISDDLVLSYHLLLACFDFIYANAYMSGRKDIINKDFPDNLALKSRFLKLSDVPCVLDVLCSRHDGKPVDAKSIKEYTWRKHIKLLFEKRILKGNNILLSEILDANYFEQNFKSVNKVYEEYVLSVGTFDERIFLGRTNNSCTIESLTCNKLCEISEQLEAKRKINTQNKSPGILMTPLTCRQYLRNSDRTTFCPLRSEVQNFALLQTIVGFREAYPSEDLRKIIDSCEKRPVIEEYVIVLATQVKQALEGEVIGKEFPEKQCEIVIKLFYKLIDSILPEETKKPAFDPNSLLNQEVFIKTLFACSFEIAAFLCTSAQQYPWIANALKLPHYYFYKIIEVVVRAESSLSRDVVKHLKTIEEKILDNLAWKRNSPLWKAIIESGQGVPCSEDVMPDNDSTMKSGIVDFNVDRLTVLAGKDSALTNSPGTPLADNFKASPQRINFKRVLTSENMNDIQSETAFKIMKSEPNDGAASVLISKQLLHLNDHSFEVTKLSDSAVHKENKRPRRTGPVALFFRKFYYLASVRMLDLCDQLKLMQVDVRQKIWTCFEETIVKHVGLMFERHLDQLLMCSIYVISKIIGIELAFTDVMKCYRNQPQALSDVYREVLSSPDFSLEDIKNLKDSDLTDIKEERIDIIKFYNTIYITKVKSLVRKFNCSSDTDRIILSPIPQQVTTPPNTRRISEKHSLYLRSFELDKNGENSPNSASHLSYRFSRSPAKDLRAINNMVSKPDVFRVGKRLLADDDEEKNSSYSLALAKKVKGLCADRITAGVQEQ